MQYSQLSIRQCEKTGREVGSYRSKNSRIKCYANITDASEIRLERLIKQLGLKDILLMDGWMTVIVESRK